MSRGPSRRRSPPPLPARARALARAATDGRGQARLVNERISITLNPDIADLDAHLRAMDHAGIEVAVLTHRECSVLGPATCRLLERRTGRDRRTVSRPSGRDPAHVDLEDAGAVAELDRCVTTLGYRSWLSRVPPRPRPRRPFARPPVVRIEALGSP